MFISYVSLRLTVICKVVQKWSKRYLSCEFEPKKKTDKKCYVSQNTSMYPPKSDLDLERSSIEVPRIGQGKWFNRGSNLGD